MKTTSTKNINVWDSSGRQQVIVQYTTIEEVNVPGITSRVHKHPQTYTTLDGRPVKRVATLTDITYEIIGQQGEIWHEKPSPAGRIPY